MDVDVLLVSLGSTHGWRVADAALAESLRRAGASVEVVEAQRPREVRTFALTDLGWARAARHTTRAALRRLEPRAILYSTSTAALLAPRPGAIRFDSAHAENRPGRHGIWQRPVERRRFAAAPLLVPMSAAALRDAPPGPEAVVVPTPIAPSGASGERDIAAITYASDPVKKGLPRVLEAWSRARREGEELVVVTEHDVSAPGVRVERARGEAFRNLLRRARLYVVAPLREDFGIAQLEALADGAMLVTTEGAGPYPAREIARHLDPRLVVAAPHRTAPGGGAAGGAPADPLAAALRVALDDPVPNYSARAAELLRPFAPAAVDATVANELLPRLLRAFGR